MLTPLLDGGQAGTLTGLGVATFSYGVATMNNKEQWEDHWYNLAMLTVITGRLIGDEQSKTMWDTLQPAIDTEMEKYLGPYCQED